MVVRKSSEQSTHKAERKERTDLCDLHGESLQLVASQRLAGSPDVVSKQTLRGYRESVVGFKQGSVVRAERTAKETLEPLIEAASLCCRG